MILVLPCCGVDAPLMLRNLEWQASLGKDAPYHALIAYDSTVSEHWRNLLIAAAVQHYPVVHNFKYAPPPPGYWPPNRAFHETARHVAKFKEPWLWLEADAIPLRTGWLQQIDLEYRRAGKAFMGSVVPDFGHMNGVGVYPANTPERIPYALNDTHTAWDAAMKREMIHDCHDCMPLIQHTWGFDEWGRAHPYKGSSITFKNREDFRWITPTAVVFHRNKDGTLLERLKEARKVKK